MRDAERESKDVPSFGKRQRMDPLTESLGCTSFYHQMRWPWLKQEICDLAMKKPRTVEIPLSVSRYYHEKRIAIDIGPVRDDVVSLKAELCKKNGIEYAHCVDAEAIREFVLKMKGAQ